MMRMILANTLTAAQAAVLFMSNGSSTLVGIWLRLLKLCKERQYSTSQLTDWDNNN